MRDCGKGFFDAHRFRQKQSPHKRVKGYTYNNIPPSPSQIKPDLSRLKAYFIRFFEVVSTLFVSVFWDVSGGGYGRIFEQ